MRDLWFTFLLIALIIVGSIASVKLRENYADQKINQEIKQNPAAQENRAAHQGSQIKER